MEMHAGQIDYPLPPISTLVHVMVKFADAPPRRLVERSALQMDGMKKQGPEQFARVAVAYFTVVGSMLTLWPPPREDGTLTVRYFPPYEEV